jgi:hypothetical protein
LVDASQFAARFADDPRWHIGCGDAAAMKSTMRSMSVMLASVAMFATPTIINADIRPTERPALKADADSKDVVAGTVKEKSDKELTVTRSKGQTEEKVALTSETRYTKHGANASLDDVKVGARVKVTLKSGTREAEAVKILGEAE